VFPNNTGFSKQPFPTSLQIIVGNPRTACSPITRTLLGYPNVLKQSGPARHLRLTYRYTHTSTLRLGDGSHLDHPSKLAYNSYADSVKFSMCIGNKYLESLRNGDNRLKSAYNQYADYRIKRDLHTRRPIEA
jgi:hypothetical protein